MIRIEVSDYPTGVAQNILSRLWEKRYSASERRRLAHGTRAKIVDHEPDTQPIHSRNDWQSIAEKPHRHGADDALSR